LNSLDYLWVIVSACFVFFMQAGFICYEVGVVQAKNVVSVAIENILTFVIAAVVFFAWGFGLMFGAPAGGVVGGGYWLLSNLSEGGSPLHYAYVFFQLMFAGASVTIFSGSMSERTKLSALLLADVAAAGLIYPVFGHWVWGGNYIGAIAWLQRYGFVDFAGATVVHATAGWLALAGICVVGARRGRFTASGRVNRLGYSNIPFAALGMFILWFSWFGFNGGSLLAFNETIGLTLLNTNFAAVAGVGGAVVTTRLCRREFSYLEAIFSGALGGLVAITAGSNLLTPLGAALTGLIAGCVVVLGSGLLLRLGLDDAVGAVPIHAFGGVTGTVTLALFAPVANLPLGVRLPQLLVQIGGAAVNFLWAFGLGWLLFRGLDRLLGLRVDPAAEERGLNITEFADIYSWADFLRSLNYEHTTRRLGTKIREQNRRLQRQAQLLQATQEQERRKLGRDLHDGVGQSLAAVKLQLGMLRRRLHQHNESELEADIGRTLGLVDTAIEEIRGTILNLRPASLQEKGLRSAVEDLAATTQRVSGLRISTVFAGTMPDWDETETLNIYRIVQECLANVIKHAAATAVTIEFSQTRHSVCIRIADNGHGFAPDAPTGVGLASMRERATMLGGTVQVNSNPENGTTVVLEVPGGNA